MTLFPIISANKLSQFNWIHKLMEIMWEFRPVLVTIEFKKELMSIISLMYILKMILFLIIKGYMNLNLILSLMSLLNIWLLSIMRYSIGQELVGCFKEVIKIKMFQWLVQILCQWRSILSNLEIRKKFRLKIISLKHLQLKFHLFQ